MNYQDLQFYHIYPLGFCGAESNNLPSGIINHRLRQISNFIPTLKALGINAIYIGPLFQSETHGYDTIDYYQLDSRLGDQEDLKIFVKTCHDNEIKVVLDCVFNHVSRSFFAFKDILENKMSSPYIDWFKGINFGENNPYNDGFNYENWDGHYHLVKLNLSSQEVKQYLINVAQFWMNTYSIDGLRMDAADVMDLKFLKDLSRACKSKNPEFFILGEIVKGDYLRLINEGELDAVTNYECYKGLYSSLNDSNYFEIAYSLNRQFGENGLFKDRGILYNFVDNHDVNRVASVLKNEAHLYPLYIMLYTIPGIPSLYYLSEYGQKGMKIMGSDEQIRTAFKDTQPEHPLYCSICKLAFIRNALKSLRLGNYQQLFVSAEQLVFSRSFEEEQTIVLLNSSNKISTINLQNNLNGTYWDLLNEETIQVRGTVTMHPNWGRILKKL